MDPTLILYALVAGGLVFWLKSILGTRSGEERDRPNPFTAPPADKPPREKITRDIPGDAVIRDDVVTLPLNDLRPALPRGVSINDAAERGLNDIARADKEFDVSKFVINAQDAFVIIVEAFASGDRETLKTLLEPKVYDSFEGALKDREARGDKMSTEIHSVRKTEFLKASFDGREAFITLRFIADETCVIRDKDHVILSGDPDRITEMNDVWTFSRLIKNRDPVWLLHETRDGDVKEDHKTPVPDAG